MTGNSPRHLSGERFARALKSGIHRVINEQDVLNRINVFPVPDGDTGTNLSLTLSAALHSLDRDENHLGTILAALADSLLDGARGNSGAILAQFFQGVSDSAGEISRFTTYTFGKAVETGSSYARDAIAEPREGTILSVIAAFAAAVRQHAVELREESFNVVLPASLARAEKALAETTGQLDALRRAGVVDAGGKGFVTLFDGVMQFLVNDVATPRPDLARLGDVVEVAAGAEADSDYRYCTECIVSGTDIDRRKLREALGELGDSLVLAGTRRKAKVHIHVNDPGEVFGLAADFGEVSAEKADDMHRQTHSSHDALRKFAVITDSAADIPDEDLERLDIHMVPCRVQFGERSFIDKVSISNEEFFAEVERNPVHPTTSQPAPGDFRRQYQFLATHYADVLSVSLSAKASGTWQAAVAASERVNAPGKVRVVDTLNASTGEGLLAVFAAECAEAGMTLEDTLRELEARIPLTRTFALVNDLKFAVRGGRVPGYVKPVAEFLRVTPIIRTHPDGRVTNGGFLFGRRRRIERFAELVAKNSAVSGAMHVAIGHALAAEDADTLRAAMREVLPEIHRLTITELGAALGVHGGPGTLIVATMPEKLPDPA
ncbi:MAG: DegV family protein [Pseudomonadota bacterium]